ncbi:MAG: hypothetical protein PHZ02_01320 [Desulfocapsaceae bacterium]|nr:hypothetical protein [Desulfocapsaceae bacterium]
MAEKTGPKSPRNKVERVLLIHGRPDFLYKESSQVYYSVKIDGKEIPLGKVGETVVDLLTKVPGAEVIKTNKKEKRPKIPVGYGIKSIQKSGSGDTVVRISAPTDEDLLDRITAFEEYTSKNGYDIQERCLWVCKTDPKHDMEKPIELPKKKSTSEERIKAKSTQIVKEQHEIPQHTQQNPAVMSKKTKDLQGIALKVMGKT